MGHQKVSACFIFSLFIFCLISRSEAQKASAIYVFGDSLVDVGNNNYLKISLAKANFPHNGIDYPGKKPTGRFCNGKNAADFLAEKVGLQSSPPYLSLPKSSKTTAAPTGVSFASGGAGIFNGTDELFRQSIPLTKQVEYYAEVYGEVVQQLGSPAAQEHLSKSVFAIVIGSNDLFGYFQTGSKVSKTTTPQQYVDHMVSTLKTQLMKMHTLGARKFVVVGVGAIGCCPSQRRQTKTGECNEEANLWSINYNKALVSMLQDLKSQFNDINYTYFDTYTAIHSFIQTPATYGFIEVKSACCGLGKFKAQLPCVPISTYCSNRSDHLFWDLYHPTEASSRMFVDTIFTGSQQLVFPMNLNQLVAL